MSSINNPPDRLRGIYTIPVNDGAGLLNGKDTVTRDFAATGWKPPPIQLEAAKEIERLRAELALSEDQNKKLLRLP